MQNDRTKKERVIAAIQGNQTDGIPSSFSLHFPVEQARGEAAVEAHLKFFNDTDTDIIKVMNEHLVPSYGMVRTPVEYAKIVPKIHRDTDFIDAQVQMTRQILTKADPNAFSMGTLHGICASGIHVLERMGEGYNWYQVRQMQIDFLRWDEKKMLGAMERIADGMCALAEGYIKDAGGYCFLHMCKSGLNMKRYDADYAELADVVNWGVYEAPMSLEEGRKQFGGKTILSFTCIVIQFLF